MQRKHDYVLFILAITIVIIGVLMVYSASNIVALFKFDDKFYYLKRQIIFAIIGVIVLFIGLNIRISFIYKNSLLIFIISLIFLSLVLIPGIGIIRGGARSWIGIGSFSFQPSEIMKLSIIVFLSKYLSSYEKDILKFKYFFLILIIIGFIFLLVVLEPDFGTGLIIVLSSILLLFLSGAPILYFILLLIVGIILGACLIIIAPYRLERIMAFINPWKDPLGSGFQSIQSIFAIAPSGIFGVGYNNSIQKRFFLPEPQNDFIFAIICEELGIVGGLIVIGLFSFLIIRVFKIGKQQLNLFNRYICYGVGSSLFTQIAVNLGVVTGLLPVTGITLPIISYGGTSLVVTLFMISIVINISKNGEKI